MHAFFLFFLPCLFGRTHQIIKFLTTWTEVLVLGRGHVRHIVDMHNFYFIFSSVLWGVDQTSWVYSCVDKWRVFHNCKFHDPMGNRGKGEGWNYIYIWWPVSIYSTCIAIVLRAFNAVVFCHCWFLFILWWVCWYANMNPSDKNSRNQGVQPLTLRWPLRPVSLSIDFLFLTLASTSHWLKWTLKKCVISWLSTCNYWWINFNLLYNENFDYGESYGTFLVP